MKTVSVFVPTYNGQQYIARCLNAVRNQLLPNGWQTEIIVIDSSSTDSTIELVRAIPGIKLSIIPKSEFQHGTTRNLAAQMAKGEFVVYLTQDAIPVNDRWLSFMIEPFFLNENIVAVLGKQVPRKSAPETIKREVSSVFNSLGPDHSLMIHRLKSLFDGEKAAPQALGFMSDVNAAYRRSYLLKHGFKNVSYAEDQLIGDEIINSAGLLKAYTPFGAVEHSNDYGPIEYFYRKIDERTGLFESLGIDGRIGKKVWLKNVVRETLKDHLFTIHDKDASLFSKVKSVIYLNLVYNVSRNSAQYLPIEKILKRKGLSLESRRGGAH